MISALLLLALAADGSVLSVGGKALRIGNGTAAMSYVLAPPFNPVALYDFGAAASSTARLPPCTSAEGCVVQCAIGAVTGSATAFECVGPTGSAVGSVSDPAHTTISSFIPGQKAREIVGADAPTLTYATLDAAMNGAHTVVISGMSRDNGTGFAYWLADNGGIFTFRDEAGGLTIYDWEIPTWTGGNGTSYFARDGWGMAILRFDGTQTFTVNENGGGNLVAISNSAGARAFGTGNNGSPWYFGTRAARDLPLSGPAIAYTFYSAAKSDDWCGDAAAHFYGSYFAAAPGTTNRLTGGIGQHVGIDNTSTTGNVDIMFPGATMTSALGIRSSRAFTNVWAADPQAAATWTAVADGVQSLSGAGDAGGHYNASVYVKAGDGGTDTTHFRLRFDTNGVATPGFCDFTLDGGARYECRTVVSAATDGGTIHHVLASLLIGSGGSDGGGNPTITSNYSSGPFAAWGKAAECDLLTSSNADRSIQVCQAQLTASLVAEPPTVNNYVSAGNAAHGNVYHQTLSAGAWPATACGGKYELIHTPLYDPLADWLDTNDEYYVFDVTRPADVDHTVARIYGYQIAGRTLAVVRDPPDLGGTWRSGEVQFDQATNGIGLTRGLDYASSTEWRVHGGGCDGSDAGCDVIVRHNSCGAVPYLTCRATDIISSSLDGTSGCPANPWKLTLGSRNNGGVPASTLVKLVRIYTVP